MARARSVAARVVDRSRTSEIPRVRKCAMFASVYLSDHRSNPNARHAFAAVDVSAHVPPPMSSFERLMNIHDASPKFFRRAPKALRVRYGEITRVAT